MSMGSFMDKHLPMKDESKTKLATLALNLREVRSLFIRKLWKFRADSHQNEPVPDSWKYEQQRGLRIKNDPRNLR